jgi:hypothetical protein
MSSEYRFQKFLYVTSLALAAMGPMNHKWESRVMMRDSSIKNLSMISDLHFRYLPNSPYHCRVVLG